MIIKEGWLQSREKELVTGVRHCISPNYDERPTEASVSLLVLHNISLPPGNFGGGYIDDFFMNQLSVEVHPYFIQIAKTKVSAHVLIDRKGEITQYVSFNHRAWHAGVSCFQEKEQCNDFSIGLELEGTDEKVYTEQQYESLQKLTDLLLVEYPLIKKENIVGHCHIAPERKTDPGESFDWPYFLRSI